MVAWLRGCVVALLRCCVVALLRCCVVMALSCFAGIDQSDTCARIVVGRSKIKCGATSSATSHLLDFDARGGRRCQVDHGAIVDTIDEFLSPSEGPAANKFCPAAALHPC